MTKTFCDMCKKQMESDQLAVSVQIGARFHELCEACNSQLTSLLEGTGVPATVPNLGNLMPFTQPYTYPLPIIYQGNTKNAGPVMNQTEAFWKSDLSAFNCSDLLYGRMIEPLRNLPIEAI